MFCNKTMAPMTSKENHIPIIQHGYPEHFKYLDATNVFKNDILDLCLVCG